MNIRVTEACNSHTIDPRLTETSVRSKGATVSGDKILAIGVRAELNAVAAGVGSYSRKTTGDEDKESIG